MKRHALDAVSLVLGLLFLLIALGFLSGGLDIGYMVARFWPIGLIVLGLAILVTSRRSEGP